MTPQIVRLTIEELQYVQDIAHRTWPSTFRDILTPAQIEYMLDWMYNFDTLEQQFHDGQRFYAVKKNDQFLGFAAIELNHPEPGKVKLHKLYVLPDQHGKGFGKKLMDHVAEEAKREHMQSIVLNVNRYNSAVKFYENYGFSTLKEEIIDIGSGFIMDDFVMGMAL
jgi:ribosomal protein S18 acetylase RimI-like enzyme